MDAENDIHLPKTTYESPAAGSGGRLAANEPRQTAFGPSAGVANRPNPVQNRVDSVPNRKWAVFGRRRAEIAKRRLPLRAGDGPDF